MSLRIATNVTTLAALGELGRNQQQLSDAAGKLASGSRVSRSADDAAALTISQTLTTQINGLVQAAANAHDAAAVAQIADGALATVHDTLQRMRQLVVRAANTGGGSPASLTAISREIGALTELLNAIADFTAAGGHTLLDGSYSAAFQVGPYGGNSVILDLSRADMHAANIGGGTAGGGIDLSQLAILGLADSDGIYTVDGVSADLATLSESIVAVSGTRSDIGALASQLNHTVANLDATIAAISASRSSLTDADMADEAQRFVAATIKTHAAAFVVAQANSAPKAVLRLLDDSAVSPSSHPGGGAGDGASADSRSGRASSGSGRTTGSGRTADTGGSADTSADPRRTAARGDSGADRHGSTTADSRAVPSDISARPGVNADRASFAA